METNKIAILTIGAPASGKSTLISNHIMNNVDQKETKWIQLERDIFRENYCKENYLVDNYNPLVDNFQKHYYSLSKETINEIENNINKQFNNIIETTNDNIILSNMNLSKKSRNALIRNLKNNKFDVKIYILNPTLNVLLEQNKKRKNVVNENIIFNNYMRLQNQISELREMNNVTIIEDHPLGCWMGTHKSAVLCDLDGTISHIVYDNDGNPHRTFFEMSKVHYDEFDHVVFTMVNALRLTYNSELIFLTGRTSDCFVNTKNWLDKHLNAYGLSFAKNDYKLYSRLSGDYRKDSIIKEELYNTYVKDYYDVIAVFDDRPQVVNTWHDLGLKTIAVADQRNEF